MAVTLSQQANVQLGFEMLLIWMDFSSLWIFNPCIPLWQRLVKIHNVQWKHLQFQEWVDVRWAAVGVITGTRMFVGGTQCIQVSCSFLAGEIWRWCFQGRGSCFKFPNTEEWSGAQITFLPAVAGLQSKGSLDGNTWDWSETEIKWW